MYVYFATLVRVIDADTYEMDIDLGFYVHVHEKVRLRGANAPERFTPEGKAATVFVQEWFRINPYLVLETHKSDLTDKYGRWVADVTTPITNVSLADVMISSGHAVEFLP